MIIPKSLLILALFSQLATWRAVSLHSTSVPPAGSQAPVTQWQKYEVEDEEFSVALPAMPTMSTENICIDQYGPGCSRRRRERIIGSYGDGVVYGVYTWQRQAISIGDVRRRFSKRYANASSEKIMIGEVAGNSFQTEDDVRISAIRIFATDHNFYAFEAVAAKIANPRDSIAKFFSSITFDKRSPGVYIKNASDTQPSKAENNISTDAFSTKEVNVRPFVVIKPEPRYTEDARKNQVVGTVALRVVFSSTGVVDSIEIMEGLPRGLTEAAIAAARQMKFIPSIKDGRFVSTRMQLEYNFNLY